MSCGDPHDMDCARAIEQVYVYLDGEMPDEDCAEVRRHLEECAPCWPTTPANGACDVRRVEHDC